MSLLLQAAQAALQEDELNGAKRAGATLTVVLGSLARMALDFDKAARGLVPSSSSADGASV